jgi:hypothetical protein
VGFETKLISLSEVQKNILQLFYNKPIQKISINKSDRTKIWDDFIKNRDVKKYKYLEKEVPAFFCELEKALSGDKNLQPAVFSECVYAQTLAHQFLLPNFTNLLDTSGKAFHNDTINTIKSTGLPARYCYTNSDESNLLVQAGGAGSVDCALISQIEKNLTMIEFKEQYARTSEPDLPKYGEDGYLISSPTFDTVYPQFKLMLKEHLDKRLNVFEHLGSNEGNFSDESIEYAVLKNYSGNKFADVICTEDDSGFLVMLPTEHVSKWAKLEGEIRPSGRNSYKVWSPKKLLDSLKEKDADVKDGIVTVQKSKIKPAKERGGSKTTRYKINPLFFVRAKNISFRGSDASFKLESVMQLNPSITAKMNFKGLKIEEVRKFYLELLSK